MHNSKTARAMRCTLVYFVRRVYCGSVGRLDGSIDQIVRCGVVAYWARTHCMLFVEDTDIHCIVCTVDDVSCFCTHGLRIMWF